METILRFFAANEGLVYVLLALGGLWVGRQLFRSLREWQQAIFGLERVIARQRFLGNTLLLGMILGLAFLQFLIVNILWPSMPFVEPTPTLSLLSGIDGTPVLPPALGTPVPSPSPVVNAEGCIPGQLTFTSPQPGQDVSRQFQLKGTIKLPNFGFYKYEVSPVGTDNWATISAGNAGGEDVELGVWDTTTLAPGDYLLRLVVTDNEGNTLPPCIIPVRVKGQ